MNPKIRIPLFIAMTFFVSIKCFSQTWLPQGATWHTGVIESFSSPNQGYIASSVVGDSTILSIQTRLIQSNQFSSHNQLIQTDTMYMYENGGRIFHFTTGQFYKLYDFNLMPGDTWQVSVPFPSPYTAISMTSPDTLVTIIVDSVSTTMINGHQRKLQYVHSKNNDWYFFNPIIEGIGSAGGFFPFTYDWQDNDIPFLRCYNDSLIFYQANSNFPCDTLIDDVSEPDISQVVLFPNPAHDQLIVSYESTQPLIQISIFDCQGREWIRQTNSDIEGKEIVNISQLSPGYYFCEISNKYFKRIIKIIKY